MRRLALCSAASAIALVFLAGCVTTPPGVTITSRAPEDTTESTSNAAWQTKRAWIFVEGVKQLATPATVTVRRSFEITNVSLHVGPNFDQVRRYEIERTVTGSRRMADFSFSGRVSEGFVTFSTRELSQDKKGNYIIPFYEQPIQIVDNEYDLVIIVRE